MFCRGNYQKTKSKGANEWLWILCWIIESNRRAECGSKIEISDYLAAKHYTPIISFRIDQKKKGSWKALNHDCEEKWTSTIDKVTNYYFTFNSSTSWIYLFTLFVCWFNDLKIRADRKLEKPSPSLSPNSFSSMIGVTILILLTFFSPRLQLHEESDSEMLLIREEFLITRFVFATMEKRVKSSWKWNWRRKYPRKNEAHKKNHGW